MIHNLKMIVGMVALPLAACAAPPVAPVLTHQLHTGGLYNDPDADYPNVNPSAIKRAAQDGINATNAAVKANAGGSDRQVALPATNTAENGQ